MKNCRWRKKQTTLVDRLHVGYWRFFGRCKHLYLSWRVRTIIFKNNEWTFKLSFKKTLPKLIILSVSPFLRTVFYCSLETCFQQGLSYFFVSDNPKRGLLVNHCGGRSCSGVCELCHHLRHGHWKLWRICQKIFV